jgi:hypothetical protein
MRAATTSEARISDGGNDGGTCRDCFGEEKGGVQNTCLNFFLIILDGDNNSVFNIFKHNY